MDKQNSIEMTKISVTAVSDQVLKRMYESGNWSMICFFAIVIILHFNGNFIIYSATFTAGSMNFQCQISNFSTQNNSCESWDFDQNKSVSCINNFTFFSDSNFVHSSIISEFQLVCDRSYLSSLAQSLVIWGLVIGGFISPVIGDYFGRKKITFICIFSSGVLGVVIVFCPNFTLFAIGKCLLGILREISMTNGYILAMEVIPSKKQSLYGMISQVVWCVSTSSIGLFGYLLRDWKTLQIVGSMPALLIPLLLPIVSESPRWLISRRKYNELQILITMYVKRWNRKTEMEFDDLINKLRSNEDVMETDSNHISKPYYPCDLFKSKSLIIWTGILTISWIYGVTASYSLNFITTLIPGNAYLNYCVSSILDILGIILSFFCLKSSRNITIFIFQIISSISFLVAGFLSNDFKYLITILIIIGKLTLNGSQYIIAISGLYIYPSTLRLFGANISCTIGKIAAVSSPYFVELFKIGKWLPMTIIGIFSLVVGILNLFFPDWINQPLPETVKDVENLKMSVLCFRNKKRNHLKTKAIVIESTGIN